MASYFLFQFLICSLAFATFSVEKDLPQNRLQLSFTLVLTAVAFKSVVNSSLPRISYLTYMVKLCFVLFSWLLTSTDTVKVICRLFQLALVEKTSGVPPCIISGTRGVSRTTGIPSFQLAGQLPHMKESKVTGGIRTHSGDGQVIQVSHLPSHYMVRFTIHV